MQRRDLQRAIFKYNEPIQTIRVQAKFYFQIKNTKLRDYQLRKNKSLNLKSERAYPRHPRFHHTVKKTIYKRFKQFILDNK